MSERGRCNPHTGAQSSTRTGRGRRTLLGGWRGDHRRRRAHLGQVVRRLTFALGHWSAAGRDLSACLTPARSMPPLYRGAHDPRGARLPSCARGRPALPGDRDRWSQGHRAMRPIPPPGVQRAAALRARRDLRRRCRQRDCSTSSTTPLVPGTSRRRTRSSQATASAPARATATGGRPSQHDTTATPTTASKRTGASDWAGWLERQRAGIGSNHAADGPIAVDSPPWSAGRRFACGP